MKQSPAAIPHLLDWSVVGQVIPHNPASSVAGPVPPPLRQYSGTGSARGKAGAVQSRCQYCRLARLRLDRINWIDDILHCADRDGLGHEGRGRLLAKSAVIGAPREIGDKQHMPPCHHTLEVYLHTHRPQFRKIGRGTGQLSPAPLPQANPMPWCASGPWPPCSKPSSAITPFEPPG